MNTLYILNIRFSIKWPDLIFQQIRYVFLDWRERSQKNDQSVQYRLEYS